jgi:hypothetical protein
MLHYPSRAGSSQARRGYCLRLLGERSLPLWCRWPRSTRTRDQPGGKEKAEVQLQAAAFIETVEVRQGLKIGCPEEIAYRKGFIDATRFRKLAERHSSSEYGRYLLALVKQDDSPVGYSDGVEL